MKKITALVLLSILPSLIYSMESQRSMSSQTKTKSQEISPEAEEKIDRNMRWARTNAKTITLSPDGTQIAVLTGDGDVELFSGNGVYRGRVAVGQTNAVAVAFNEKGTEIIITDRSGYTTQRSTYRAEVSSGPSFGYNKPNLSNEYYISNEYPVY